jgi:hypothetical protein
VKENSHNSEKANYQAFSAGIFTPSAQASNGGELEVGIGSSDGREAPAEQCP